MLPPKRNFARIADVIARRAESASIGLGEGRDMAGLSPRQFELLEEKYEKGLATEEDLAALEPYRARRAVLFASGFGSRMLPITINTPKPLVRVKGRRIIESLLDALAAIDVEEIYIVVGYLADEFELLRKDYPNITLIRNDLYDTTNNISSAVCASEHFSNAYAFESDLMLSKPGLLKKYNYESWYLGVPVESTEDWCLDTEDGYVVDLHKGGRDCHHMYGVSYWTAEAGERLAEDLPREFSRGENRQRFWDDVPCVICRDRYRVRVRECAFGDIDEIDSFAELQQIDPAYRI